MEITAKPSSRTAPFRALELARPAAAAKVTWSWISTTTIHDSSHDLADFAAVWVVPASPYASIDGALAAIRFARETGRPFLGTCGGFQHALIEFAATSAACAIFPEGLSLPPRITLHLMKAFRLLLAILAAMAAVASVHAAENPSALIPRYEKISAALMADNFSDAQTASRQLAAEAASLHRDGIAAAAQAVAKSGDIAAARDAFKILSSHIITLARHQKGYFIMTCPMAQADWLQSTRDVANPYLGKDMPTCGTVKEETKG